MDFFHDRNPFQVYFTDTISPKNGSARASSSSSNSLRFQLPYSASRPVRCTNPNAGYELSKEALELAKVWFDDLLSRKKVIETFQCDFYLL